MSLSFRSFTWTRTGNTGKLMRAAQCKDSDRKSVGNFLGHFKAPSCSQSSASSYRPAAEMAKGTCASEHPQAPPSAAAQSHLCWAFQRVTVGTGGPEARARAPSHCSTAALIETNWCEKTGGILKSAQQPPACVDLRISIGAHRGQGQWLEKYKLSGGTGEGNYLLGFPARCIRRPLR